MMLANDITFHLSPRREQLVDVQRQRHGELALRWNLLVRVIVFQVAMVLTQTPCVVEYRI